MSVTGIRFMPTLTDREYQDCDTIFNNPVVLKNSQDASVAVNPQDDPDLKKIYDEVQRDVSKELKRSQCQVQPAKMILARSKMKKRNVRRYTITIATI